MTTICSNCFEVNHMRVECGNQRANYLDYVNTLMKSGKFEIGMFGNWKTRVEKYLKFKENLRAQKQATKQVELVELEEETYVEAKDDDRLEKDDDESSISSYKSTETVVEQQPEQETVLNKLTSFITGSKTHK